MKNDETNPSRPEQDGSAWWWWLAGGDGAVESPEAGAEVPFALATPRQGWDD